MYENVVLRTRRMGQLGARRRASAHQDAPRMAPVLPCDGRTRDPNRYKLGAMILDARGSDEDALPFTGSGPGAGRMVRKYRLEIGRGLFLRRRRERRRALRVLRRSGFGCLCRRRRTSTISWMSSCDTERRGLRRKAILK